MVDNKLLPVVEFFLNSIANYLNGRKISADTITIVGFVIGVMAVPLIILGAFKLALLLIILNRIFDGLDGILARMSGITDRGAFLDISLDFIFYASIPVAFALFDPPENSLPALVLLFSFFGTGSTFLAFSIIAERKNIIPKNFNKKGFHYLSGLVEGFETILFFLLMCLLPTYFQIIAYIFSFGCLLTTIFRLRIGWSVDR
jgi:phosphatidylglycerophosphate synthase